jgi:thymidine phosphorylase
MDVKCGCGAFMKTRDKSKALAELIASVGNASGVRTEAIITAMDFPLGQTIGNSLEVIECLETLKGRGPRDLEDLSVKLAARMVRLAGLANTDADAEAKVRTALTSGAGLEKWRQVVEQQGGDPRSVDDYSRLPAAPQRMTIIADRSGYVTDLHAERLGIGAMLLGAGRNRAEDKVDHAVGIMIRAHVGERVKAGDTVLEVHYRDESTLAAAMPMLREAIKVGDKPPQTSPLILEEIRRSP